MDLTLDTDVRSMTEVWLGQRSLQACLRDGSLKLTGPRALVRAFPSWLLLSVFDESA